MREPLRKMNSHALILMMMMCVVFVDKVTGDTLPTCQPKDFHYEYTECDSEGGRWRVSVPKPNTCIGGAPNPPVRGKDCSFTCSAGQFLDLDQDQTCQPCPAGTYSLGGGVRFDDWETLPDSFSVTSHGLDDRFLWRSHSYHGGKNCSKLTWKPRGSYMYALPGACTTILTYSTKLVRAGHVTFEYQYTDSELIFHFIVQNDQCSSTEDENGSTWPDPTDEGKWGSMTVPLKSGTNILQWRVIGTLSDMTSSQKPILIQKIEVTGVAFTSECTKCRNGTYSSGGTAFCAQCSANQFSTRGSTQCQSCQADEYSEPGSGSCLKRPPCNKYDYYEYQTPCDQNKQTRKIFKWKEPRVCNDKASGSVTLPASTDPTDCPPCNRGMYPVNESHCEFCADGFFSDGQLCEACPVSTSPEYGLDYEWWTIMPPNMTSRCVPLGSGKCTDSAGWGPAGDHLITSFGSGDRETFIVLTLGVGGFRGEPSSSTEKEMVLGQVKFNFELNCTLDCQLVLLTDANGRNAIVKTWTGSQKRQEYVYDVYDNGPLNISWAFQPLTYGVEEDEEEEEEEGEGAKVKDKKGKYSTTGMDSVARIYSVKVTNTVSGGATKCVACPKGTTENGCVPCPDGQYIDQASAQCLDCPPNTVLPSSNSWGAESCKACGEGLKAFQRKMCRSDCRYLDKAGRLYDFTALDGVHYVQGGRLFTSSGTMYYHGFNLTLCNAHNDALPVCVNNVSANSQNHSKTEGNEIIKHHGMLNMQNKVTGMICRSTLVPQSEKGKSLVSTQPVSLASHLTKIVTNVSLADLYSTGGFDIEGSELDVHFYYKSETPTMACPKGRTTIISLHCDPDEKGNNSIHLPPKCADGTCDGCTFHFLWRSRHACPRCQKEDYDIIKGECVGGEQLIHFYPPEYCLPADDKDKKPMKQKCQLLPFAVMVAIPVALGVGVILILLLIYCWSRNRRLEYKYSKLVESSGGRDGELPGVESCGMEEGEEDESVHFSDRKGPRLLQKIRLKISGIKNKFSMEELSDDDNPFVAVQMHEKLPLT